MIHIVQPPHNRPASCPFVQRTQALVRVLDALGEQHRVYPFEREAFVANGYGSTAVQNDLIFFSWPGEKPLVSSALAIECGVGYDMKPWGPFRVYETEAWRHYMFGKYDEPLDRRRNSWVIPWAFDIDVWPLGYGEGRYVSYLGRLQQDKGLRAILALAKLVPDVTFKIASTDHACALGTDLPANVEFVGPVLGDARVKFLGDAIAHLCPTEYVEPLNGSAIEAMLCGTPVIASNYGGFTETIQDGVTGFRCSSVEAMACALEDCRGGALDRSTVRLVTSTKFSLGAAADRWRRALAEMHELAALKGR